MMQSHTVTGPALGCKSNLPSGVAESPWCVCHGIRLKVHYEAALMRVHNAGAPRVLVCGGQLLQRRDRLYPLKNWYGTYSNN